MSAGTYDEPADGHAPEDIPGTVAAIKGNYESLRTKAAFWKSQYEAGLAKDAEDREARKAAVWGGLLTFGLGLAWGLTWLMAVRTPPPGVLSFWASGLIAGAGLWLLREGLRR